MQWQNNYQWLNYKKDEIEKATVVDLESVLLEARNQQNIDIDRVQKHLYEERAGRCGCCCSRWIRSIMMSYRAMRKNAETIHYSSFAADKYFLIQMLHGLDLFTDFNLC